MKLLLGLTLRTIKLAIKNNIRIKIDYYQEGEISIKTGLSVDFQDLTNFNIIQDFLKIPFINKGIDFIDLQSIFRDKNIIDSIPKYFKNTENPLQRNHRPNLDCVHQIPQLF
mgnify:CR=1 FL=1